MINNSNSVQGNNTYYKLSVNNIFWQCIPIHLYSEKSPDTMPIGHWGLTRIEKTAYAFINWSSIEKYLFLYVLSRIFVFQRTRRSMGAKDLAIIYTQSKTTTESRRMTCNLDKHFLHQIKQLVAMRIQVYQKYLRNHHNMFMPSTALNDMYGGEYFFLAG